MWYVRRYNPLLWDKKCCLDAVSLSNLSTEDNDISIWKVSLDRSNIEDIALAIAMTRDKLNDFHIVFLSPNKIRELGLNMNPKIGDTRYKGMVNEHDNIVVPTFWEIGFLGEYIHSIINNPAEIMYVSEPDLQDFLYNAVKVGKIDKNQIMTDKDFKKYKQPLQEMEKIYGEI